MLFGPKKVILGSSFYRSRHRLSVRCNLILAIKCSHAKPTTDISWPILEALTFQKVRNHYFI